MSLNSLERYPKAGIVISTLIALVACSGGHDDKPGDLGGNPGRSENTIWGTGNGMPFPETISTPWAAFSGLHTATCEADGYLAIGTVSEVRQPPLS